MNQCWRVKDTIRAEWRKDSQTASSLIFFVIDTASWFAFRLQQERMGSHVHRASRCRNLIKKNTFQMNALSSSLFLFLSLFFLLSWCPLLPSFSLLNAFHPHFKTEAHTVNITVCGTWLSHRWLWEKKKKNCTFHLSSWLESHLDKSSVFFWKKKNTNKANSRWPCPRIHH